MANIERLRAVAARVKAGGPQRYHERLREQGKMFARERLRLLLDDLDEFIEDGLLARCEDEELPADAVVTGVGRIGGRTVYHGVGLDGEGGLWESDGGEDRNIQEKALSLNVLIVYLVDSAGVHHGPGGDVP